MADDNHFQASGNWWESSRNMRFESGDQSHSSSSGLTNIDNFCWQQQQHDMVVDHMKTRSNSSMEGGTTSVHVFHDNLQQQQQDSCATNSTSDHPNLQMMGLGLSSQAVDWNQASLLRGEKASESSFRSMLQENLSSSNTNFQHETGFIKQVNNRGFSLDQTQFSPQYSSGDSNVTIQGIPSTFHTDHYPSILQGLLGPESNLHPQQHTWEFYKHLLKM